jgi:hypothetical protein
MRKIIVNGKQYRYWVSHSRGNECKVVTIRNIPGIGCAKFYSYTNVTPRMIKTYIEWNPELIKKEPESLKDAPKLYESYIDYILHQQNIL